MKIIPIYYHVVSDEYLPHVNPLYKFKSTHDFERDINSILKDYRILDLDDIKANREGLVLSFDDGFSECYNTIFPILKKHSIPAFFFLNNDFIDNKDMYFRCKLALLCSSLTPDSNEENSIGARIAKWHIASAQKKVLTVNKENIDYINYLLQIGDVDVTSYLKDKKPYLTSAQIEEMINAGYYFGGHSYRHLSFKEFDANQQVEQLVGSTKKLVDQFNLDYNICSIPHNDDYVKEGVIEEVSSSMDYVFGGYGLKRSNNYMRRISNEHYNISITSYIKWWKYIHLLTGR